jgi:hypothetical protein
MMLRPLALPLLALAMILAAGSAARAQPADDVARARELFVEGAKLAEAGSWEAARDRFERSLKQKRAALTLYNLGIAQQETGHLVDALESFRAFLALPADAATQPYVVPVRAELAKLEKRVAYLEIDVRPAGLKGAVVRIDGREVPAAPGPRMVDPGNHEIAATAPGYGTVQQKTVAHEGGQVTMVLTLGAQAPAAASTALPTGLIVGGLAALLVGEITFGIGAQQGLGSPVDAGPARAAMIGGTIAGGAGILVTGIGAILLLRRPAARAPQAAIAPWSEGGVTGIKVRF